MNSEPKAHDLKTDPAVFEAVWIGTKTHEIRLNDRDFKVGDVLNLRETVHSGHDMRTAGLPLLYTGREIDKRISHIQQGYGLMPNWVILSFENEWQHAVEDACVVNHMGWDEASPLKTLAKLIQFEVEMALDPAISERACRLKYGQPVTIQERAVLDERAKQRSKWSIEHDDEHDAGTLAAAASARALEAADRIHPQSQGDGQYANGSVPPTWPEEWFWESKDPYTSLRIAAALCIAEMERMNRKSLEGI